MISVLALAGIGISYAGLTDTINIYGNVNTATVQFDILEDSYSGTWVWKIYDQGPNQYGYEITVTDDPDFSVTTEEGMLVSYALSRPPETGETHDVYFEFSNLFPLIPFEASFQFKTGSIPVKEKNW